MTQFGHAAGTDFIASSVLADARNGTGVPMSKAAPSGLPTAPELREAGYTVRGLDYPNRPGGPAFTLRGGNSRSAPATS